jgi:hypothetical protein
VLKKIHGLKAHHAGAASDLKSFPEGILTGKEIVGSHSSHVPYARDLCEARIYAADTASE